MDNALRGLKKIATKVGNKISPIIEKFDSEDPLIVLPYRGYANDERIFLKGRILEDENIFTGKTDSEIRNIINSFKRFETDEVPEANVKITSHGHSFFCIADVEGYFTLDQVWNAPPKRTENKWLTANVELLSPIRADDSTIKATGEIYFPAKNAGYGVITDIDDTILQSHVTSLFRLKMLYATFLQNVHDRLPMEGMPELFQSFVKGSDGKKENPIFYLSHSPWNIYDLLEEFLELHNFPKGPILLRDYGLNPSGEFKHHKLSSIAHILEMYPELPFILLGDSADEDADFYIDIATKFPDRIKAIYIRQTRDTKNARRIKKLIEDFTHAEAILVRTSEEINLHALENGYFFKG